jgi:asparagine synthase (glutamine-hydrolysing)
MNRFLGCIISEGIPHFGSSPKAEVFGKRHILYRGYISNHSEINAEARRRGNHANHIPEAEMFALGYEWWGADLSRHILGEYAVAVADGEQGSLLLAHDELGLMPLFYSQGRRDAITFSSHLDDLALEIGIGELDEEYIADHFARGEHFGDRTPYTHVRRLLLGESLVWKNGVLKKHNTWTLANVTPLICKEREYEERLLELVTKAVEAALPPSRKVWCELSGGLDSSTVLSIACHAPGTQVEALSFIFPESKTSDESKWIGAVLQDYPVPWHPINYDSARPFTEMADSFFGEPTRWIVNAGWNRLCRQLLQKHNVDVVLTGEGGDAVLFGGRQEPYFLADFLLKGRFRRLWNEARRWCDGASEKRPLTYWLLNFAMLPAVRHLRSQTPEYRAVPIPWASESYAKRRNLNERGRAAWVLEAKTVGDSYMLHRVMRSANVVAAMLHSRHMPSEFRSPLLSRPLVEFMLALPSAQQVKPSEDRVLQRRALVNILPGATLGRRDKGFSDQPSCEGLASSDEWVAALTAHPRIVERGYARLDEWRKAVERARFGRTIGLKYFEASATLEMWLQSLESVSASRSLTLHPMD